MNIKSVRVWNYEPEALFWSIRKKQLTLRAT